jgi:CheY-like chemotaxis protein
MKRILVADDSHATRSLVAAALNGLENVEVERVSSGVEALKLVSTSEIDLILTDVHMPEINGIELIRIIKSNQKMRDTPVVIMSTEAEMADRDRGMSSGADDFLAKPFTVDQLCGVIRKHLGVE